jgi:hypothetical protein
MCISQRGFARTPVFYFTGGRNSNMTNEFKQFIEDMRDKISKGIMKSADGKPLEYTLLDLGIMYAVLKLTDGTTGPVEIGLDEIEDAVAKYCGKEVADSEDSTPILVML